ncbi:MAG: DAK2 domain-containing protein [Acidimicrobiales bacterium]
MNALERLTPGDLREVLRRYGEALDAHREAINRLNVYPVPDGDTGTNMALTVSSALAAMGEAGMGEAGDATMAATCESIGHGALMGARGNSGLILSQCLRGMCERFADEHEVGPVAFAEGLANGADTARSAVSKPVDGTILTVARAAADGAGRAVADDLALAAVVEAARQSAADALAATPDQLEVLARAGVVDAGGAGYVLMLDAFLAVVAGRPLPPAPDGPPGSPAKATATEAATGSAVLTGDVAGDLRYEVMYLLEAPEELIGAFKECWAGVGESIVVVGAGSLWNCHIHTDDIGAAIEAGLDAGRPRNIRVSDLTEQVEEERWVRDAAIEPAVGEAPETRSDYVTAVVAVANGQGISRIFRSLGVAKVVLGGQSMNPSTAEILEAIDTAPADQVLVLPNNDNIEAVARSAADMSDKSVVVLPTEGVGEGFAALMEYDPYSDAEANVRAMGAAAARVLTGQVTRAVRSSGCTAGPIAEGDWLGMSRGRIEVVGGTIAEAAIALLAKLCTDDHELVTLIEGEGARPADTRQITEWLGEQRPRVTPEVHHGGQPMYPYLISVE